MCQWTMDCSMSWCVRVLGGGEGGEGRLNILRTDTNDSHAG